MPDHDNDRLEQFFRKAASKSEVSFNEQDWQKLEARLDAKEAALVTTKKAGNKIAAAVVVGVLVLSTGVWWANSHYGKLGLSSKENTTEQFSEKSEDLSALPEDSKISGSLKSTEEIKDSQELDDNIEVSEPEETSIAPQPPLEIAEENLATEAKGIATHESIEAGDTKDAGQPSASEGTGIPIVSGYTTESIVPANLSQEKIARELIMTSPAIAEKYKQKAGVALPGAEEADTREADAMVSAEHASHQKEHVATPRLSLLLSYAPDFSSTSIYAYSAPGSAFGAMLHYHIKNKWSISAGVIKNNKKYTGSGEDYKPPKGYWKYYTNGIVPTSIDGACNILEFPVMVQYTLSHKGKNKWLAGAGASSYFMLSETYRYNFEEPNPGAKEGWNSRQRTRFLFNMVNFTIAYEHQVLPGLMIGIEPYVKVPLEEIGWSNLKLFSTGASVTLRYKILGKQNLSMPTRSRGPD